MSASGREAALRARLRGRAARGGRQAQRALERLDRAAVENAEYLARQNRMAVQPRTTTTATMPRPDEHLVRTGNAMPYIPPWITQELGTAAGQYGADLIRRIAGTTSTAGGGLTQIPVGSDIDIMGEEEFRRATGQGARRRRRRRRLLTCSDKADIAFLHGQLGGGALGKAAISSILSRRCG